MQGLWNVKETKLSMILYSRKSYKLNPNVCRANLSNDYFTNRQDRYFVFEDCPALASFYHSLIETVSRYCLQLGTDDSTSMPTTTSVHPYQVSQKNKRL